VLQRNTSCAQAWRLFQASLSGRDRIRPCHGHRLLLLAQLTGVCDVLTRPLRSIAVTAISSLLRAAPPLDRASVLSASCIALVPFPSHRNRRFPQFNIGARTALALPLCRTPHGQ
jgi:hypothetical protein